MVPFWVRRKRPQLFQSEGTVLCLDEDMVATEKQGVVEDGEEDSGGISVDNQRLDPGESA